MADFINRAKRRWNFGRKLKKKKKKRGRPSVFGDGTVFCCTRNVTFTRVFRSAVEFERPTKIAALSPVFPTRRKQNRGKFSHSHYLVDTSPILKPTAITMFTYIPNKPRKSEDSSFVRPFNVHLMGCSKLPRPTRTP